MIQTEPTESRKQKAYNAGKDYAMGNTDESCLSKIHWQSEELADEWDRGYNSVSDEERVN